MTTAGRARTDSPAPFDGTAFAERLAEDDLKRFTLLLLATLALPFLPAASSAQTVLRVEASPLDGHYDRWLVSVSQLMTEAESRRFRELGDDLQREVFIRRFWESRKSPEDDPLARWRENFIEAERRFEDLDEDRARAVLIAGKPRDVAVLSSCHDVIRHLEIWSYGPWHVAHQTAGRRHGDDEGFLLLFVRDSDLADGVTRQWSPADGAGRLTYGGSARQWSVDELLADAVGHSCYRSHDAETFARALRSAIDAGELRRLILPPPPDPEWLEDLGTVFTASTAEGWVADLGRLPALPANLEISFPGRYQQKTILQATILVPVGELRRNAEGLLFDRVVIQGDVRQIGTRHTESRPVVVRPPRPLDGLGAAGRRPVSPSVAPPAAAGATASSATASSAAASSAPAAGAGMRRQGEERIPGRLVDVFEVVHLIAGAPPEGDTVPLELYRRLRPGTYLLNLRAEDANGLGLLRQVRTIEVPQLEEEAVPPPGRWNGFAALTREQVGILTTFPSVELLPPGDDLAVGEIEIAAVTTGGPIERVDFLLDGEPAGSDSEAPFVAELDLGEEPRRRQVTAVAFDPSGREIARDVLELSATRARRFAVRLIEPHRGSPYRGSSMERALVLVEVPETETLDRVELYLNERRIATLRQPPFVHPLAPISPDETDTVFLRAVAWLRNGQSAEDVVVVYSRDPLDEIDVQLVELYTTVLDRRGRPVTGLTAEDFQVLEDGVEQTVRRFATVENLAINVALLMDVSGSMRGRVKMATRSAQRFFETVMRAKDLVSLSTFNHDIRRWVPFTNDVERLRYGADGFRAFGTTRLHDSLVYTVHSFGGLEGKRALVLLSDGQDVDSDFQFKQVRESTLRSGVAVYPIMLDLDDEETRANLELLARETGGSYFSIRAVAELDQVYRRIEQELRSQYLLVYQSPPGAGGGFRRVEVEVLSDDLEAKTLRGYYP